jgi:hypothetical protein
MATDRMSGWEIAVITVIMLIALVGWASLLAESCAALIDPKGNRDRQAKGLWGVIVLVMLGLLAIAR